MITLIATTLIAQERVSSLTGNIVFHEKFSSAVLKNERRLSVYLPPNYATTKQRYPVLYMHDGQNIFDGKTSYIPNKEWRVDEAAESLILAGIIEPIIIVGIDNSGAARADEYLPNREGDRLGGKGALYASFLIDEVMPFIDKTYRTQRNSRSTGLCGSSLGGVITQYIGLTHPNKFGKLAIVSPSAWIGKGKEMSEEVTAKVKTQHQKIWIDLGSQESGGGMLEHTNALVSAYREKGYKDGKNFAFYFENHAGHNEEAWARRMPLILQFLYGKKYSK